MTENNNSVDIYLTLWFVWILVGHRKEYVHSQIHHNRPHNGKYLTPKSKSKIFFLKNEGNRKPKQ